MEFWRKRRWEEQAQGIKDSQLSMNDLEAPTWHLGLLARTPALHAGKDGFQAHGSSIRAKPAGAIMLR